MIKFNNLFKKLLSCLLIAVIVVCSVTVGYAADEKYKNWKQG